MEIALWVIGIAAAGWSLDRLMLAAEARGWIYYRRRRGHATMGGVVADLMVDALQPSHHYVIEERDRRDRQVAVTQAGEPSPPVPSGLDLTGCPAPDDPPAEGEHHEPDRRDQHRLAGLRPQGQQHHHEREEGQHHP